MHLSEVRAGGGTVRAATREFADHPGCVRAADGRTLLGLASGDCLGLADHPRVRRAASEAAERHGAGGGAGPAAGPLAAELAEFLGRERCLLFDSARAAARAAVAACSARGGIVAYDERGSSGLVDGARASRAEAVAFAHRDVGGLAALLRRARGRRVVIATDSVFAETGELAPLGALRDLAARSGARLVVDESHALGVFGRGIGALGPPADGEDGAVVVGSLGYVLGSQGGFAATSSALADAVAAHPEGSSLETLSPPAVGAARAALALLRDRPGHVAALRRNAETLRRSLADQGFDTYSSRSQSHIVSIAVGDPRRAASLADRARAGGVLVEALTPPSVPTSRSAVRATVAARHRSEDLATAARVLGQAAREVGVIGPGAIGIGGSGFGRAA